MRVIAGRFRSRGLVALEGTGTRPTSDRLRETLFNILDARVDLTGCRFADLYAGTGAVGIEALSRGAAHCWFAEKESPALKALRENLARLGISRTESTVDEKGAASLIGRFLKLELAIDIVFVDPPYDLEVEYTTTMGALGREGLIAENGVVVVEFATKGRFQPAEQYGRLRQTRIYKQGQTSLGFYGMVEGGNAPPK